MGAVQRGRLGAPEKNAAAASASSGQMLARHLKYSQKYGTAGIKELENGRFRYYGIVEPSKIPGEMIGRRYVHEFNPSSGQSRGWNETIDEANNVRQVRPQLRSGLKTHYVFDINGTFTGIR